VSWSTRLVASKRLTKNTTGMEADQNSAVVVAQNRGEKKDMDLAMEWLKAVAMLGSTRQMKERPMRRDGAKKKGGRWIFILRNFMHTQVLASVKVCYKDIFNPFKCRLDY